MTSPQDPGFCGLDDAALSAIRLPPVQVSPRSTPDFNYGWFPPARTFPYALTAGNYVVPFIQGECAFEEMATAFSTAIKPESHRIYILAWELDPATEMTWSPGGSAVTFKDLISQAGEKVPVRAMLWDSGQLQWLVQEDNSPVVKTLIASSMAARYTIAGLFRRLC